MPKGKPKNKGSKPHKEDRENYIVFNLTDTIRVERLDDLNLSLQEYRPVVSKTTGEEHYEWIHLGYHGNMKSLLVHAARQFADKRNHNTFNQYLKTQEDFLSQIEQVAEKFKV